jgi:hypothetical protein
MAMASLVGGGLAAWLEPRLAKHRKALLLAAWLAMAGAVTATALQAGKTRRDGEMIHDVHAVAARVPRGAVIGTDPGTWTEWSLHMYFARHYNISLDGNPSNRREIFIARREAAAPEGYLPLPTVKKLQRYALYRAAP